MSQITEDHIGFRVRVTRFGQMRIAKRMSADDETTCSSGSHVYRQYLNEDGEWASDDCECGNFLLDTDG